MLLITTWGNTPQLGPTGTHGPLLAGREHRSDGAWARGAFTTKWPLPPSILLVVWPRGPLGPSLLECPLPGSLPPPGSPAGFMSHPLAHRLPQNALLGQLSTRKF